LEELFGKRNPMMQGGGKIMKKLILNKFYISKTTHILLMVLLLSILVFPNMGKTDAQDTPGKSKMVKANYREKVKFSRDIWIKFPDFDLIYLGTGVYTWQQACFHLIRNFNRKIDGRMSSWVIGYVI
jgi:hypothetical protein